MLLDHSFHKTRVFDFSALPVPGMELTTSMEPVTGLLYPLYTLTSEALLSIMLNFYKLKRIILKINIKNIILVFILRTVKNIVTEYIYIFQPMGCR